MSVFRLRNTMIKEDIVMYKFSTAISLFLLFLIHPLASNAEQAELKRIVAVKGGKLEPWDRVQEMKNFVFFIAGGTQEPIYRKTASLNDTLLVKSGANLLMEYRNQKAWLNYDTKVTIRREGVEVVEGELYALESGDWFNTGTLALLGLSEYYLKVGKDGKTTLYVVNGQVLARDKAGGQEKIVSQSKAIDESLNEVQLPEEEIRRILMWKEQLKLPIGRFASMRYWVRRYWWTSVAGVVTGIVVKEVIFPCQDRSGTIYVDVPWP